METVITAIDVAVFAYVVAVVCLILLVLMPHREGLSFGARFLPLILVFAFGGQCIALLNARGVVREQARPVGEASPAGSDQFPEPGVLDVIERAERHHTVAAVRTALAGNPETEYVRLVWPDPGTRRFSVAVDGAGRCGGGEP